MATEIETISKSHEILLTDTAIQGDKTIITQIPLVMYDAINSTVVICDPLAPLKTKEEEIIYDLSILKTYNPESVAKLKQIINNIGMSELANTIDEKLKANGKPDIVRFYAMVDIITEEFCKKIGDQNQDIRVDVLSKVHKLADPKVFDHVQEYSQQQFNSNVSQLILTQDDPIMKRVYDNMLVDYGLDVILVPDPKFDNLRKNSPELYSKIAASFNRKPSTIGFYDDTQNNLNAASKTGILTQLATGAKNDDPEIIKKESEELVNKLFEEKTKHL